MNYEYGSGFLKAVPLSLFLNGIGLLSRPIVLCMCYSDLRDNCSNTNWISWRYNVHLLGEQFRKVYHNINMEISMHYKDMNCLLKFPPFIDMQTMLCRSWYFCSYHPAVMNSSPDWFNFLDEVFSGFSPKSTAIPINSDLISHKVLTGILIIQSTTSVNT